MSLRKLPKAYARCQMAEKLLRRTGRIVVEEEARNCRRGRYTAVVLPFLLPEEITEERMEGGKG